MLVHHTQTGAAVALSYQDKPACLLVLTDSTRQSFQFLSGLLLLLHSPMMRSFLPEQARLLFPPPHPQAGLQHFSFQSVLSDILIRESRALDTVLFVL